MAETFGTATAFVLQELPVDAPGARTVELFGRALPYRPMAVGGTMRAQTDWYPGNPVATVQILGPEEKPITVKGMWKDRFIRDTTSVNSAIAKVNGVQVEDSYALFVVIDEMRRQGRYIRLTWDLLIREGFIEEFVATFDRHEDIEWDLTFKVTSQGDTFAPAVISSATDLTSSVSSWYKIRNSIADAASKVPFQQALAFAQKIASVIGQVEDGIVAVTDAVSAVSSEVALSVPSNARRMAGIAQGVQDSATTLVTLCGSQPPMTCFVVDRTPTFGDYISAQTYLQSLSDIGRAARYLAAQQRQQFIAQVQPDLVGQFIARDGTDLRDVSKFYYGTPDQWRTLMLFNGFLTSALNAGDLVLVPKLGSIFTDPTSS